MVEQGGYKPLRLPLQVIFHCLQGTIHRCVAGTVSNVDLCPVLQQKLHNADVAVAAGVVQGRMVLPASYPDVGPTFQQPLHHPVVAASLLRPVCIGTGRVEGCLSLSVPVGNLCSIAEVELRVVVQAVLCSHVQWGSTVVSCILVDQSSILQEQLGASGKHKE